jgi:hypothetical protein
MTAARLPVIKDLGAFTFEGTPINEGLVRSLHAGAFLMCWTRLRRISPANIGPNRLHQSLTVS